MAKQLGPTFSDEIHVAGLGGLPFTWGATDDTIEGRENLTTEQNATLDDVVAAHDPMTKPPAVIPFGVFLTRWTTAEYGLFMQMYQQIAVGTAREPLSVETAHIWDSMAHHGFLDMNLPGGPKLRDDLVAAGVLTQARADAIFN
jgi:hypothetical protein